jgi:ADP-ribosylglycohydrolase
MISKEELIKDEQRKIDKAFGALVGLAIGDSFGDASRTQENHLRFGITMDFTEEASWSTDDTEFALLTAQAIIDCGGKFSSKAVVAAWEKYILHQTEYHRGGNSEIEAALNLRRGLQPPLSGMYNAYHISDGAAMRAAPIGIVCAGDLKKASEWAEMDASVSHYRDGVWGAQAVAAGVACAMVDGTVDEEIEAAKSVIPNDSWFYYTFTKAMAIIDQYETLEAAWTPLHTELWTTYKAAVPEAVSQAFALFRLSGGDFRKGVIYSGNFGRDADTIGAIVGALLGALHGAQGIPSRWVEKVRYPTGTCLDFAKGKDLYQMGMELAQLIG